MIISLNYKLIFDKVQFYPEKNGEEGLENVFETYGRLVDKNVSDELENGGLKMNRIMLYYYNDLAF